MKVKWYHYALLAMALFGLLSLIGALTAKEVYGEPETVEVKDLWGIDFIREENDPGNVIRGMKFIYNKQRTLYDEIYYRPKGDAQMYFQELPIADTGMQLELQRRTIYHQLPLGIKFATGQRNDYIVRWRDGPNDKPFQYFPPPEEE